MKNLFIRAITILFFVFVIVFLGACSSFEKKNSNENDLVYQILNNEIKDEPYIAIKKIKKEKVIINLDKNCLKAPSIDNGTLSEFVQKWQEYNTNYKDCNLKNEALKKEIIAISKFLKNVEVVIID